MQLKSMSVRSKGTLSMQTLLALIVVIIMAFIAGCNSSPKELPLFSSLTVKESGIDFENTIEESNATKSFINEFGYMGGGVGIGDFNNDGLKDIFFTANQLSCRMYINKGSNHFEDITGKAGLTTTVWTTGVSIVDINNDGFDDLYVCSYGKDLLHRSKNLLFINQRNLTFKEEAEAYGLADSGYSSQAVFVDYDMDGDLDMYLANYMLNGPNANTIFPIDRSGRSPANDKLYRNDGRLAGATHPVFTDVTQQAGIKEDGLGLGVVTSDFNEDGWPDIYVANDFISNDRLWLNNKDGSFSNCIGEATGHQSYSSMGADVADINNDALPDVMVVDMLPEYNERKKTSFMFMNYDRYEAERAMGYEPEFMRNMLHLNNGTYTAGKTQMPFFSEIGQMAGVAATDWSWSVLMADFNNDGWKDMHITNGIGRDFINGDFLEFSNTVFANSMGKEEKTAMIKDKLVACQPVTLSNYLFLNNTDYTFRDASSNAGIDDPSLSNGAAYADLDNDGDLDMVVNNINKPAFVFVNNTITKGKPAANHYLAVQLKGESANPKGFGAKVLVYYNGEVAMQEQNPVRGYYSSVDQKLVFGLGKYDHVDSVVVRWPGNKITTNRNVHVDTVITISSQQAVEQHQHATNVPDLLFADITSDAGIIYRHRDNSYNDFALQRLLPQKYSQQGPFIATGDINNDKTTDFFVGGGFNFSGRLFSQQPDRSFISLNLIDSIKMEEDLDCLLFDADGDNDEDLLVTRGDIRYEENSVYYIPRLYINNGKGAFSLQPGAIPAEIKAIAGCVSAGDYDGDGDEDLFIGGRVSRNYPMPPRSYILQNNKGVFADVTASVCPELQQPGMITGAVWTDIDNDKKIDIVVAGEWMPVRFFRNEGGRLQEITGATGLTQTNGIWRSLVATDMDKDGDMDLVAGNFGTNCIYHPGEKEPMELFAADLDENGTVDPVFFYYIKEKSGARRSCPAISRSQFAEQVPSIKKKFLLYKDYAGASFNDIFNAKVRERTKRFVCDELRSCYFENTGNGKFKKHILPAEAQFAPVNAILCDDFDNDGLNDLLLAGNEYQAEVMTGRYDASYGCFLKGLGKSAFKAIPAVQSGFMLKGDVKDMAIINSVNGEKMILAAVNDDTLRIFRINTAKPPGHNISKR